VVVDEHNHYVLVHKATIHECWLPRHVGQNHGSSNGRRLVACK
jgi:hypothetical protein